MNEKREQILAALKKLGPSSPSAIADRTGMSPSLCGYHLRALEKDKAIKATGKSNNRRYALPDQEFDGAPPQADKKPRKKKKGKRGKAKKARTPRARAAADPAAGFIPGLTAGGGLVLVGHAADPAPIFFNPAETSKLADLLLAHYEA